MSNVQILFIALGLALGVSGALFIMLPMLKNKNVQVDKVLEKADVILDGVDGAVDTAKVIMPGNQVVNVLETIETVAHKAVNAAQQLFISSQLPSEKRKEKAKEYALAALKVLKIDITPELGISIDGAIEDVIFASKTKEEINSQKQQAEQNIETQQQAEKEQLQKQITDLQSQNAQLQQDNVQLKNNISTIQNTVQVVTQ
jgi:hypothetical protein